MKRNIKNFLVKAFSMCLAFILVFPTNLFAMGLDNTKTRKYKASASIMGLAQTDTTSQDDEEVTDQTLLETEITRKETDKYLIEKYAKLSKTTGIIEYIIKVQAKDKKAEDKVTTSFAISKNTDLEDLKIEKVNQVHSDKAQTEIKYQEQRPSILYNNDAFGTLGVTTDKADLVYYLSAKLTDDALANIDDKSPTMDLDYNIGEDYQDRYALTIDNTEVVGEDGQVDSIIQTLKEKDDSHHQVKAIYKEGNTPEENPKEITWTDFIHTTDDKEFTYDINVDDGQDATDSLIKVEFYQATDRGYILKEDFTKEIPFTNSLKLQIPLGFIAKVELKTKVIKNLKEYSLNQTKIPNPIYKEEKTEEKSEEEDADPLPEESPKTEEAKDTDKEKIIPIDPETNEAVIDHSLVKEDTKEESEPVREETSAINLNRDSVINNFKNNDKLNPVVEITINNISSLFNSYNNDEMTYEDFLASLKTPASDLSKEDFAEIVKGLIAGLNQETYKVADIDEDQLLAEIYGKDEAEEAKPATEEDLTETKEADTKETSNVETDNVETDTYNVDTETKEDFRTPEEKIKDNALKSFDETLAQAKENSKKPQEDDRDIFANLSEGIKGIFGQSNLQKADQELKAALEAGKSLEEIQALLDSFEEKYQLSREEQVRLMGDNGDAIKALIAKDSETNFRPHIFVASEINLDGKKFHVLTRFDTSTVNGPIKKDQYFNIHLDDKLTVKNPKELKSIYNGNTEIARPSYDETNNIIKYEILNDIPENIQIPLDIPVDYKTNKIELDENGEFVVVNKVSGLGVADPKSLLPQRVDRNGNLAATIIEPDKKEVAQLIEVDMDPYKVYTDANATPVIKDGKLIGFNWTIKVTSDTDLFDLGYKANFTTVKGSGLEKIEDRNKSLGLTDQLDGAFGINDSKHHKVDQAGIREVTYNLYTPVEETPQEKYMMDISIILTEKGKVGAKRIVVNEGWPIEKVREETPNRVGMNNRTTILGEFTNETTAKWTVTDAVSTGDGATSLPLENRSLGGVQNQNKTKTAVYGLNDKGEMVPVTNATETQPVGTIGVYEYTGTIGKDNKDSQTLGGVSISRYQDITVDQNWNLPDGQKMPSQTITVTDKDGNKTETNVKEGPVVSEETGKQRFITVPDVKYWDIDNDGKATFRDHTISQTFPQGKVTIQTPEGEKEYKYSENANYYRPDTRVHYIQNSLEEDTDKKPATFTVIKVDSKDPEKRIPGASFDLLGANVSITTDANGEATFRNIKPGRYYLTETKAPDGYKIDQNQKTIEISDTGQITVYGGNAKLSDGSGKTAIVEHSDYPNWPDYMNTMHYGKLDKNGNLEFYVYLKPFAPRLGGRTDKDTRFNISIPGVNLTNTEVKVYDLDPQYREYYTGHMEKQTMDQAIVYNDVTNVDNNGGKITGTQITTDPYTKKSGYSIFFPQARFGEDWGFLVKVKANVGTTNPVTLSYDWLADKNTATNSKIQEAVTVSTNPEENGHPTITITNEPFKKSSIEVAKFADSLDDEGNRVKLPGAEFVLKDANGKPITNDRTDKDGKVNFGEFPPGTYYLEEQTAPAGYEKSDVYFEVKVNEKGEVTYTAKFKTSSGTPVLGQDYFIDKGESTSTDAKAEVLDLYQHMDIKDSGRGRFQGVWEAYELESLKYELKAKLNIAGPGSRFEVQFDKNLDFTQYFTEFPDLYDDGKVIAKPYFDRNTNLLTYVFTENAKKGETTIGFNLVGMIPNKFYAKTHGVYPITNVVQPGTDISENIGNQTETIKVDAYFGEYDAKRDYNHEPLSSPPTQAYYFRDVYQDDNGNWYVKAFAYYNPLGLYSGGAKNIRFNWMSTNYQQNKIQHEWNANGNLPAFQLDNVKVYKTDKKLTYATYNNGNKDVTEKVSAVMPLSMGIRPEQDPSTYRKVFETNIDPRSFKSASSNDVYLEYDPEEIKSDSTLQYDAPLKMTMPKISGEKEGYVIEQTFKIPDIKKFNENWRGFYMGQNTVLRSTFVTGPNKNYGNADQTGQEIPKFYEEIVGIINRKFTPGKFKITKTEDNTGNALQGAVFALTDQSGNTIYRSSGQDGLVEFKNLEPGSYTLVESKAPEGYTGSKEKWEVIVSNDGSVRIEETSVTSSGNIYTGNNTDVIKIPVANRKTGGNFQVFKKDDEGEALQGATFTITKEDEKTPTGTATSDKNGIVNFAENLTEGTYIIEETNAPDGFNRLNKKWVLVISKDKDGKLVKKVYNYSSRIDTDEVSLLGEEGTYVVNVKDRPQIGWESFDNRNTGWAGNSTEAQHLGTRIIAINKTQKYVIQRYIINPEAKNIDGETSATIHREKPNYPNMDWYNGEDYKVFTLAPKEGADTDGKVTGLISDIRLADYTVTDITEDVKKTAMADSESHYGETRLKLQIPETNKPIVIDVKIPYKYENGGVGTGMDWRENGITYWKSDYYERVSDIVLGDSFQSEVGSIKGSYIGENSLDVTNEPKTYGFKIKKVKENDTDTLVPGAKFKLTGENLPDTGLEVSSDDKGIVEFTGLKPGIYTLEETEAAPGYEKTNKTWTVTIEKEGKAWIKENTSQEEPISRAKAYSADNQELEVGDELVSSPQRAGDGWEAIDPGITTGGSPKKVLAAENGAPVTTEITEINKSSKRFRQEFVYSPAPYKNGVTKRKIQIHRQPESYDLLNADTKITVYQNLNGVNKDITSSVSFKESGSPLRLVADIPATIKGTLTVKVETKYDPKGIGLGTNYDSYVGATGPYTPHDSWVAYSYSNEDKINKRTRFNITGYSSTGGSVTASSTSSEAGESITLNVSPQTTYRLKEGTLKVTDANGGNINVNNTQFTMPASDVTISAEFEKIPEATYKVTIGAQENGSVSASPTSAAEGETVNLTVTPAEGFEIASVSKNGQVLTADSNGQYKFTMPAGDVTVSATFKQKQEEIKPPAGSILIGADGKQITNKQTGLEFTVFKVNNLNRRLPEAEFTIVKYKDNTYKELDSTFKQATGTSDENGLVQFKDKNGNVVSLPKGHYIITETKAPEGYKKAQAPWKLEVYEDAGQLKAKYSGPEDTANGLLTSDKAKAQSNQSTDLQTTANGIKYKSRLTYINPESKTYVQRIYIDTRNYTGKDKVNVQITPKYKRDEIDYVPDAKGAKSPDTIVEGVKTAYRTTYKITGGVADTEIDNVLRYYDLSKPNVTMENTARWRPFDWGFDEDLLNLDKGVYFIDIEGFYDDAIITGYDSKQGKNTIPEDDQGKLDLNIDFYDGERKFQQRIKDENGNLTWTDGTDFNDAYLLGNVNLGFVEKNDKGQDVPTEEGLKKANPDDKYPLWLGKTGGRIYPSLDNASKTSISTRVDISSLYSSDSMKGVPQDGLTLTNEEETYNITFSKHGRDNSNDDVNSEAVTKKRLEGAIFKLQEDNGITFEDVPGSYVASAFNGYFGFRGLKPGRYRLLEVKAPEGYVPIKDPLLYFTVETITTNSGKIIHPLTGAEVDIKTIKVKFPDNNTEYELKNLKMIDPKDENGTTIVDIKGVESKDIDIEEALIINPSDNTKNKKVLLKDLSIPGSNNQDYKIGDTRVVEGKSGYISLEYDKANGVYQYVPEKSTTTKEGKLIDFVTSATAKNMGKIINEKPGEGEVTIKKFDQNGKLLKDSNLLPGAEFTLINLTNGDKKNGTIGTDGTLKFEKLQIGNYRLIETKSPDGYENTNQIWHLSVGGEGLDPYSGPIARTGVDLSDKITLRTIKASVLNPDAKTSTEITTQNNEVHPHLGESIEFENKFELAPNTKINPGDFFTLKMSEDIDLNGIFEYEIENLDIIAPGVGTIAKANYNRNARTITYTFTDYAKTYTLVEFSNKLTAFIDLYKVKSNANKNVGFRIADNDKSQYKNVNVVYDQDYGRQADHFGNTINITSKIVKYDPKTGEFLHYYYINKLKDFSYGPIEFRYESDQRIDDLKIDVAKVYNNNWQLSSTMPDSFAVNESSNNLYSFENAVRYQWLNKGYYAPVHFNDGIGNGDSYIVKVTGRVGDKDKSEYTGFGTLYKFNQGYTPTHAERHDSIRYFKNESTAKTKLEIQAVNPENNITFKKVDQNGKALAGAKFRLDYLAPTSSTWSQGSERDTDKDGVLTLTKLKPGKYKLTETSAPEGYKMAANPIMEFEVDSNGKIIKEVTSVEGQSTTTQDIGGSTNYVVNSKTYEIKFKKVDEADNTKALEGAEFEIWYKALDSDEYSKDKLKLYQDSSGNKLVLKSDETAPKGYTEVKKYTTGKDGIVKFSFTEQGYYAIKEIKAPKGYIAPREYVEEFVVMDGKVQTEQYKTEMDVNKTKSWFYANGMHDVYNTDITMRFNPDHEKVTYAKDNSKITLSGLPLNNEYYENNISQKTGITIEARLVNDRGKSDPKSYTLDLTKNYTNDKGEITIDLYELVKELEKKSGDSFKSENTIELSMYSTLALSTVLDINSKIEIGEGEDKISEDRTFRIGTKGDEKVDHSYTFTKLGEPKLPIPIENKKSTFPLTGGNGVFTGFAIIGTAVMLLALAYFGIYQNDKNRRRSARYKK